MNQKRSLYQCFNAKVGGMRIYCSKGRQLGIKTVDMDAYTAFRKGLPLEITTCQQCPDYDEMGPPIPREERGGFTLNK